jgi:hypothetical protein
MGRTRLFHTLVVVGSGMLASCSGSSKKPSTTVGNNTAGPDAGTALPPAQVDASPQVNNPPPPPRIHAVTPEKMRGGSLQQP